MAARFWVGGTGNWDASDTTHWSATSGGSGGASVPGASDTVTFDASSGGGTVTVTADHTVTSVTGGAFTGTLDYGTGRTVSYTTFNFSGTGTRSLTLGNANITLTGTAANVWDTSTNTNLTFSGASSTITATGTSGNFAGRGTYGTYVMSGSGEQKINLPLTCTNFTRTGTTGKTDSFNLTNDLTCTGTFTVNPSSAINRVLVFSSAAGTARTITAATVSVTNTDFQDITGAGAGSWDFSARTDIGDCGGNSGITFPASVTQTWSGTSGGNWSTNAWTTRVPLPQDDVMISSAFSASQTVTADMPRLGRSISWTGATGSPTWAFNIANSVFGSLALASGMTVTGTTAITYAGRGSYTITSSGVTFTTNFVLDAPGGTYTLSDAFNGTTQGFNINAGTIDTNGMTTTVLAILTNGSTRTKVLNFGTSTVYLSRTSSTVFIDGVGSTINASNATFVVQNASATARTFDGNGKTYGALTYNVAGSTGSLDITGSNSFAAINFSDASNARSLRFTAGTTTTIRNSNGFNVRGTSGKLMTVTSITGATHTLSSASLQSCDYLSVSYSTASGGGSWYAGANSTNGGNNSGWLFEAAPVVSGSNIDFTAQQVLNILYGSSSSTLYTEQEVANIYNGTGKTDLTLQQILNIRNGGLGTEKTEAQVIFENISSATGLTGSSSSYSVQELLNIAYKNNLSLADVLG